MSIFAAGTGSGACSLTRPDLPHTSMAHSSAAGPGLPMRIARNATAVVREACSGLRMSAQ